MSTDGPFLSRTFGSVSPRRRREVVSTVDRSRVPPPISEENRHSGLKRLKSRSWSSVRRWEKENELLFAMIEDESEWLAELFPEEIIAPEFFFFALEDGVLLCKLANLIQGYAEKYGKDNNIEIPKSNIKYHPRNKTRGQLGQFRARENVTEFLGWCRKHRVPEVILFESNDVVQTEEFREGAREVVICLMEVARRSVKYGVKPPKLIILEKEIEEEERQDDCSSPNSIDSGVDTENDVNYHNRNNLRNSKNEKKTTSELQEDLSIHRNVGKPNHVLGDSSESKITKDKDGDKKLSEINVNGGIDQTDNVMKPQSELDEKVFNLIQEYSVGKILRLKEGKYIILGRVMFVRMLNEHVLVRIGGGWDGLEHYLMTHVKTGSQSQNPPATPVNISRSNTPTSRAPSVRQKRPISPAASNPSLEESNKGEFRTFTPPLLPNIATRGRDSPLRKTSRVQDTDEADIARAIRKIESSVSENIYKKTGSTLSLEVTTSVENCKNSSSNRKLGSKKMANSETEDFSPVIMSLKDGGDNPAEYQNQQMLNQPDFSIQDEFVDKASIENANNINPDDNNNKDSKNALHEDIPMVNGNADGNLSSDAHLSNDINEGGGIEVVVTLKENNADKLKKIDGTGKGKSDSKTTKEIKSATKVGASDRKAAVLKSKSGKQDPDKKVGVGKVTTTKSTSTKPTASKVSEKPTKGTVAKSATAKNATTVTKSAASTSKTASTSSKSTTASAKNVSTKPLASKTTTVKPTPTKSSSAATANAKQPLGKPSSAKVSSVKTESKGEKSKDVPKKAAGADSTDGATMSVKSATGKPLKGATAEKKAGKVDSTDKNKTAKGMPPKSKPAVADKKTTANATKPAEKQSKVDASDKTKKLASASTVKASISAKTPSKSAGAISSTKTKSADLAAKKATADVKKTAASSAKPSSAPPKSSAKKPTEVAKPSTGKPSSAPAKASSTANKTGKPASKPSSAPPKVAASKTASSKGPQTAVKTAKPPSKSSGSAASKPSSVAVKQTASTKSSSAPTGGQKKTTTAAVASKETKAVEKTSKSSKAVETKASKTAPKDSKKPANKAATEKGKETNAKKVAVVAKESEPAVSHEKREPEVVPTSSEEISEPLMLKNSEEGVLIGSSLVEKESSVCSESEQSLQGFQVSAEEGKPGSNSKLSAANVTEEISTSAENVDSLESKDVLQEDTIVENDDLCPKIAMAEVEEAEKIDMAEDAVDKQDKQDDVEDQDEPLDRVSAQAEDIEEDPSLRESPTRSLRTETFDMNDDQDQTRVGDEEDIETSDQVSGKDYIEARDNENDKFDESKLMSLEEITAKCDEEDIREGAVAPTPPETPVPDSVPPLTTSSTDTVGQLDLEDDYHPGSTPAVTPMEVAAHSTEFQSQSELLGFEKDEMEIENVSDVEEREQQEEVKVKEEVEQEELEDVQEKVPLEEELSSAVGTKEPLQMETPAEENFEKNEEDLSIGETVKPEDEHHTGEPTQEDSFCRHDSYTEDEMFTSDSPVGENASQSENDCEVNKSEIPEKEEQQDELHNELSSDDVKCFQAQDEAEFSGDIPSACLEAEHQKEEQPDTYVAENDTLETEFEHGTKAEVKLETEDEVKGEIEDKVETEMEAVVKLEPEDEVKVETENEVKVETEDDVKIETEDEVEVETEGDVKIETEDEVKGKIEDEVKVEMEDDVKIETEDVVKGEIEDEVKGETGIDFQNEGELANQMQISHIANEELLATDPDPHCPELVEDHDQSNIAETSMICEDSHDTARKSQMPDMESESQLLGKIYSIKDNEHASPVGDDFESLRDENGKSELENVTFDSEVFDQNELIIAAELETVKDSHCESVSQGEFSRHERDHVAFDSEKNPQLTGDFESGKNMQLDSINLEFEKDHLGSDDTALEPETAVNLKEKENSIEQNSFYIGSRGTEELMQRESVEGQDFGDDDLVQNTNVTAEGKELQSEEEEIVVVEDLEMESCPQRKELSESDSDEEEEGVDESDITIDMQSEEDDSKTELNIYSLNNGRDRGTPGFEENDIAPETLEHGSNMDGVMIGQEMIADNEESAKELIPTNLGLQKEITSDDVLASEREVLGFSEDTSTVEQDDLQLEGQDADKTLFVKALDFNDPSPVDEPFTPLSDLPEDAASPFTHDTFDKYPDVDEAEMDKEEAEMNAMSDEDEEFHSDVLEHAKESIRIAKSLDDSCEEEKPSDQNEENSVLISSPGPIEEADQRSSTTPSVVPQVISSPCASDSETSEDEDDQGQLDVEENTIVPSRDEAKAIAEDDEQPEAQIPFRTEIAVRDAQDSTAFEPEAGFPDAKTCDELRGLYKTDSDNMDHFTAGFEQHSSDLGQHSLDLGLHSSDLEQHSSDLAHHSSDLAHHSSDLGQLSSDLEQHSSDLAHHSSDLAHHSSDLGQLSSDLEQHSSDLAHHSSDLAHHSSDLGQLSSDLEQHSSDSGQNSADLEKHSSDLGQHSFDLAHHSAGLGQHSSDLEQHSSDLEQHSSDLGQLSSDMGQHSSDLGQHSLDSGQIPSSLEQHSSTVEKDGDDNEREDHDVLPQDVDSTNDFQDDISTVATRGASERQSFDQEEEDEVQDGRYQEYEEGQYHGGCEEAQEEYEERCDEEGYHDRYYNEDVYHNRDGEQDNNNSCDEGVQYHGGHGSVEEEAEEEQDSDKKAHSDDHTTDGSDFVLVDSPTKRIEPEGIAADFEEDASELKQSLEAPSTDGGSDDSPFHHIELKAVTVETEEKMLHETPHEAPEDFLHDNTPQGDLLHEDSHSSDMQTDNIEDLEMARGSIAHSPCNEGTNMKMYDENVDQLTQSGITQDSEQLLSGGSYENDAYQTDQTLENRQSDDEMWRFASHGQHELPANENLASLNENMLHSDVTRKFDSCAENLGTGPRYVYDASDDEDETY